MQCNINSDAEEENLQLNRIYKGKWTLYACAFCARGARFKLRRENKKEKYD